MGGLISLRLQMAQQTRLTGYRWVACKTPLCTTHGPPTAIGWLAITWPTYRLHGPVPGHLYL